MRFLYFYRVPLPDPRADAIQIVNTIGGIARGGGDVLLHVETLGVGSTTECLDYYGVSLKRAEGIGSIEIKAIGSHWSWPFFNWKTSVSALRGSGGPGGVLFVREVRPYVPGLIARAQAAGLKVIFEAHNISASLVKEKEARASAPPTSASERTFSMISAEGKKALKLVGEEHSHGHDHGAGEAESKVEEPIPPNVDTTPVSAPAVAEDRSAEARRLRKKATERAALESSILRSIDGLICTQRATLDGLRHLLKPGAPATVLGNGTQLHSPSDNQAKDIDVLYCGSLKPWKGVDTLVAAMQTLYPHRLTVVGPGTKEDLARLQQAALAVGMVERLKILPPVKPSEVWSLYARARVGVIPLPGQAYIEARDFTSPLKLFEMMAAGLPIVCSRLASLQEYVADGREVLMVPPDDPRALAEALRKLLKDESLRGSLAAAARARAAEFSWDSRGDKIVAFAGELFR